VTKRKIAFLSGTRADYSKLRPLIRAVKDSHVFEPGVFVTGMHMLSKYGSTHQEVENFSPWDHKYINQVEGDLDFEIVSETISGFGNFIRETQPDLIIIHGDRLEALAGAIVGASMGILVAHIEGGELSGSVDDSFRHAISKLAQLHFVSNDDARKRLIRMGEPDSQVFTIGSPELDLMHSSELPSLEGVINRYDLESGPYSIAIFHPVTTEFQLAQSQANVFADALEESGKRYVIIESNNDKGSEGVREAFMKLASNANFRILPSMRFDFFLTLLKNAEFMIGNSSAGVREAPSYGVPSVNVGTRQFRRTDSGMVVNCDVDKEKILKAILEAQRLPRLPEKLFGTGQSAQKFMDIINSDFFWQTPTQKVFSELI
jgi:UDP-N-acetylglucosamine 2-epimerase (hydrolysing)